MEYHTRVLVNVDTVHGVPWELVARLEVPDKMYSGGLSSEFALVESHESLDQVKYTRSYQWTTETDGERSVWETLRRFVLMEYHEFQFCLA